MFFFDIKINISPKNRSALDAFNFITFMKHEKKCMYYVRKERLEKNTEIEEHCRICRKLF